MSAIINHGDKQSTLLECLLVTEQALDGLRGMIEYDREEEGKDLINKFYTDLGSLVERLNNF